MSATTSRGGVAGLLLTGGRSLRMGEDKAGLVLGGELLAVRLARLLAAVASPALEVGPGRSGLEAVREAPPYAGPLAGIVAGWRALSARGHTGPVLVLACDLPLVGADLLSLLSGAPGGGTVVPVVEGRRQLLCARWSPGDLDRAAGAFAAGERAPRAVRLGEDLVELGEDEWSAVASPECFADCDTPEDLARLGLRPGEGGLGGVEREGVARP